ncbi:hypothetical protein FDECE_14289 [Fusarium decemcellulare]|nr:hypothetical protein FDECE_14289 [Fusarium decemcellulare]
MQEITALKTSASVMGAIGEASAVQKEGEDGTRFPSCAPTEENSPTRYLEFMFPHHRPRRQRKETWKLKEAGSWKEMLKRVKSSSRPRRKRKVYERNTVSKPDLGGTQHAPPGNMMANKFISDGELNLPSIEELREMTQDDWAEYNQALQHFDHKKNNG